MAASLGVVAATAMPTAAPAATTPTAVHSHHFLYSGVRSGGEGAAVSASDDPAGAALDAGAVDAGASDGSGGAVGGGEVDRLSVGLGPAAALRASSSRCSAAMWRSTSARLGGLIARRRYDRYDPSAASRSPARRYACPM